MGERRRLSDRPMLPEGPSIQEADQLHVATCTHGNVHIKMSDDTGQVFAFAILDPETAVLFWNSLGAAVERVSGAKAAVN